MVDIKKAYKHLIQSSDIPSDPNTFFQIGQQAILKAKKVYATLEDRMDSSDFVYKTNEVHLSTPISNPGKIICVGRNYVDHAKEMKGDIPEIPVLFSKFSNALIGPEEPIEKSPLTNKLDYEVELTVVIGQKATNVKKEEALDYVAGYTIGNDITARDLQKRTLQWLQGKTLDRSTPIGPSVITPDEIGDPSQLFIRSYVNGEKRQEGNTRELIFNIPYLIEFISELITLRPGDLIMTGTPEGVGAGMNPPGFLEVGDIVTCEIENIGKLENKVIEKMPKFA